MSHPDNSLHEIIALRQQLAATHETARTYLSGDVFALQPARQDEIRQAARAATDRNEPLGADCRSLLDYILYMEIVFGVMIDESNETIRSLSELAEVLAGQLEDARGIVADLVGGEPECDEDVLRAAVAFSDGGPATCPACSDLIAENERLRAIVDKLPKYADTGEVIAVGAVIHSTDDCGDPISGSMRGFNFCTEDGEDAEVFIGGTGMGLSGYWCLPMGECCSTRKAAEAAKENK